MYIAIDGPDYSGKDTQIETILTTLREMGVRYFLETKEPGGSPVADAIRNFTLFDDNLKGINRRAEMMLMAASRMQTQEDKIEPFLELMIKNEIPREHYAIVTNRSYVSSFAYQAYGHPGREELFHNIHKNIIKPDLDIILNIRPEMAIARARQMSRQEDRLEKIDMERRKEIFNGFVEWNKRNLAYNRCAYINANESLKINTQHVSHAVTRFVNDYRKETPPTPFRKHIMSTGMPTYFG